MKFALDVFSKYRIVEEKITGDGYSNVVTIKRKYEMPSYFHCFRRKNAEYEFRLYDKKEFNIDGLSFYIIDGGWGDMKCRTRLISILIIPNNGKLIDNG